MTGKKEAFDEIEAQYVANWLRRCNAMDAGERADWCRRCPEYERECTAGLMERAAKQLELAARMKKRSGSYRG